MSKGKRMVFNAAFGLNIFAFIFNFVAFASPYWFVSWPRVYSPFKRIGLWESCFASLRLEARTNKVTYHGCWWIFAEYFQDIKSWLMPWWFVITQILCTLTLFCFLINLILLLILWIKTDGLNKAGTGPKRVPMAILNIATILTIVKASMMSIAVVLFGISAYLDRYWMPNANLNYLSWSYGCANFSAWLLIFASIAIVCYNKIERKDLRAPPTSILMGSMTKVPSAKYHPPAVQPSAPYTTPGDKYAAQFSRPMHGSNI